MIVPEGKRAELERKLIVANDQLAAARAENRALRNYIIRASRAPLCGGRFEVLGLSHVGTLSRAEAEAALDAALEGGAK